MTTTNLRHVGIVSNNLNRSIKFYKDILGFKIIKKMNESGSNLSKVMGLKNVKVTTVKMKPFDGDTMIELLYWKNPVPKKKINCPKLNYFGLTHYAMTVKNIDKLYIKLKNKGVEFLHEPLMSEDKNVKLAFCKSPDGVFIEMVQVLKK
tara:strand:+ start:395 stop:841 length:447 start_codon:yes stop_codon:yes gene_type:complete